MTSVVAERLLTEDEFLALPEDPEGRKLELLDGRVVALPQAGEEHNDCAIHIFLALTGFVMPRGLGTARMDVGFKLRVNPDRIVAPDVAFVDPLPGNRDRTRTIPRAPVLAVEVKSPEDRERDLREKTAEYLAAGSRRVWVVRPRPQTVTIHLPDGESRVLTVRDTLTSDDAGLTAPGFELPVASIFLPLGESARP